MNPNVEREGAYTVPFCDCPLTWEYTALGDKCTYCHGEIREVVVWTLGQMGEVLRALEWFYDTRDDEGIPARHEEIGDRAKELLASLPQIPGDQK